MLLWRRMALAAAVRAVVVADRMAAGIGNTSAE